MLCFVHSTLKNTCNKIYAEATNKKNYYSILSGSDGNLEKQVMFQVYQQEHEKTCCYNLCFSSLSPVSKAFNLASTITELSLLAKKKKAFSSTLTVFKPYEVLKRKVSSRPNSPFTVIFTKPNALLI